MNPDASERLEIFVRNLTDDNLLIACDTAGGGDGMRIIPKKVEDARLAAILQMIYDAEAPEMRRLARTEWMRRQGRDF